MKRKIWLLIIFVILVASLLLSYSCSDGQQESENKQNDDVIPIITVDELARHPEDFPESVGVSGTVEDVSDGYFTLGCEDICVVIPVEYNENMPEIGTDIVVYGEVRSDDEGKYVFHGQKIEIE